MVCVISSVSECFACMNVIMQGVERCQSKQPKTTKIHNKICKGVCMERVSSMNGQVVYLSWDTPGPGVSYVADNPPNSAHRHPNKET